MGLPIGEAPGSLHPVTWAKPPLMFFFGRPVMIRRLFDDWMMRLLL